MRFSTSISTFNFNLFQLLSTKFFVYFSSSSPNRSELLEEVMCKLLPIAWNSANEEWTFSREVCLFAHSVDSNSKKSTSKSNIPQRRKRVLLGELKVEMSSASNSTGSTGTVSTFGSSDFTPEELSAISTALKKRLGPNFVSQRPAQGGQRVAYIEGWKLIGLANTIFGFNGWELRNMEIIRIQLRKVTPYISDVCVTLRQGLDLGETSFLFIFLSLLIDWLNYCPFQMVTLRHRRQHWFRGP